MNANDVMRIGRSLNLRPFKRRLDHGGTPASNRSLANSTIKIAFLAVSPTSITRPIWAYTLLSK
jgi:hypothetical protein